MVSSIFIMFIPKIGGQNSGPNARDFTQDRSMERSSKTTSSIRSIALEFTIVRRRLEYLFDPDIFERPVRFRWFSVKDIF